MAHYAREVGKVYLDKTLSPIVDKIIKDVKKGSLFEVALLLLIFSPYPSLFPSVSLMKLDILLIVRCPMDCLR